MSFFPSPRVSAFADVLIALLRECPEEWSKGRYTLDHPSGLGIWVSNGFWFIALYRPEEIKFGWKKILLWLACRRALRIADERAEIERLAKLHRNLDSIRDNVVAFRKSRA